MKLCFHFDFLAIKRSKGRQMLVKAFSLLLKYSWPFFQSVWATVEKMPVEMASLMTPFICRNRPLCTVYANAECIIHNSIHSRKGGGNPWREIKDNNFLNKS